MNKVLKIYPGKSQRPDIKELVEYKDLLFFLVVRSLKARYAQSVLGVGWAIIQPLITTVIFSVVFGWLVQVKTDGNVPYILFSFTGMLSWNYFSNTVTETSNSLVTNANMISKVYFPRLVLPLAAALSKFIDFAICAVVLIVMLIWFKVMPGQAIVWLPLLIVQMFLVSIGIGLFLAAMSIQYRDVKYALTFIVQILMYAAPVVYPMSKIPEKYQHIYGINPMVGVIEGMRVAILNTHKFPTSIVLEGFAISILIFLLGVFYFQNKERSFADVA